MYLTSLTQPTLRNYLWILIGGKAWEVVMFLKVGNLGIQTKQ